MSFRADRRLIFELFIFQFFRFLKYLKWPYSGLQNRSSQKMNPAKKQKLAPSRPEDDIPFQLGPYDIDFNFAQSYHDSKDPVSWNESLIKQKKDIRNFDDSRITPDQIAIRTALLSSDRHTLITGEAGTGKTFLQLSLIKELKKANANVFRIGPTHGSIANLIDDSLTYQTFFAMPPTIDYLIPQDRKTHIKDMASACLRQPFIQKANHRVNEKSTLIIEEAAMISAEIIDLILKAVEKAAPNRIRIFFFFDILQLVPVTGKLLIESENVQTMPTLILRENIRQAGDDDFLDLLRAVAKGDMDGVHYLMLKSRVLPNTNPPPHRRLCARNITVDEHNLRHLQSLHTSTYTSRSLDTALRRMPDYTTAKFPQTVSFAIGAKIVFESSPLHEIGLHNGVTGTIIDLIRTGSDIVLPVVYVDKYKEAIIVHPILEDIHSIVHGSTAPAVIATRLQFPFSIAEATTIHKAQGQTITSSVEVDLKHMNSPGQVYTALSRLTNLADLTIKNLPPMQYGGSIEPVRPSKVAIHWCKRVGLFVK